MVKVGKLSKGNLLEAESQKIAEELQLINAENQLEAAYLNIKQLLEIKQNIKFEIIIPDIVIKIDLENIIMIHYVEKLVMESNVRGPVESIFFFQESSNRV